MALVGIFNAADYCFMAINAYASNSGIEMSATINPSSTITISASSVALDITPSVEGTFSSDYATVNTYTNTANNCTVTMTTTSTNLTSGNNTIATLSGSVSEANFTNDRWGYRVGASGDYNAVGASNQIATYAQNTGSSSALNLAVYFAAKLTPATKPGTYTDTVTFISTCAPDPSYINNLEYMQDFATLTDSEMTEVLESMILNQQYKIKDNRDEKEYYIAKLADGNVWMTQNLDHDIVTADNFYTYANTDIGHSSSPNTNARWTPSSATYTANDETWYNNAYAPQSYDPGNLCWSGIIRSDNDGSIATDTVTCGSDKHYHIGNYYNWTAAVALNDTSISVISSPQIDMDRSICPAGWRLPTLAGDKSYDNLVAQLNLTSGASGNIHNTPTYYLYGGVLYYGRFSQVGSNGVYWSSVVSHVTTAYGLDFNQNGEVYPQNEIERGYGYSVRCVVR